MPGRLTKWPEWEEFTSAPAEDLDFQKAKHQIITVYGETALRESWLKTCVELEKTTEEIASKGSSIIPELDFSKVVPGGFNESLIAEVKSVGCVVIRNVIRTGECEDMYSNLKTYVAANSDKITARTHPNQLAIQSQLNTLWADDTKQSSSEPLLYSDAVRIRPPGQTFLGLGPHIDAGSLCRWADPGYRQSHSSIFSGRPQEHDCYDLGVRQNANQHLFPGVAHSTVFRAFQGWTALSRAAPGEGSLLLYPNVATVIAYVLLRPFFSPPESPSDHMDASLWRFDPDSSWFPGTIKEQSQLLSPSSHPHLRLKECLVAVPEMKAGDTIWWHTDMCHAVEPEHAGKEDASVVYIAATPTTKTNAEYIKRQAVALLEGLPPPDASGSGTDETKFTGYVGTTGLSHAAKAALGLYL